MMDPSMKRRITRLLARAGSTLGLAIAIGSCASIGTPQGGPYDEDPPVFVGSSPAMGELNAQKQRVVVEFDEYIALTNASEKLVISPPQKQNPEVKASSKKVIVKLADSLKANTTYTIDFGDAIQDNNEGNPLEGFVFTFSTGDRLDTMEIAGTVLNAANLEPVKGILVGLHSNLADSALTTIPFDRVGMTDSRGHYSIKGIAPGTYRMYGLKDADQDFIYSQASEAIAFVDSLVVPTWERRIRQDTMWIDSLTIDTIIPREYTHFLPDDILLRCFVETNHSQRLTRSERLTPRKFSLYFSAPADSLPVVRGLNFDEKDAFVIENLTGRHDTIDYWIRDSLIYQLDTLKMSLTYLYTDSTRTLVPRTDTLRLVSKERKKTEKQLEKERRERERELERKRKAGDPDTLGIKYLEVNTYAPNPMDIYDYLTLSFDEPLDRLDEHGLHLRHKVDSLYEDMALELVPDSFDRKVYNIYPATDWDWGETYRLDVDSACITGLYGLTSRAITKDFTVKQPENYGAIFFDVSGTDGQPAFVELLSDQDRVLRHVRVEGGKADFHFLNPGKYCARLIIDSNENGQWDTGFWAGGPAIHASADSLVTRRQPEEVYYYWQILELKANFELNQTWDIKDRPLEKQKPDDMKKQKPDETKKKNRNTNK